MHRRLIGTLFAATTVVFFSSCYQTYSETETKTLLESVGFLPHEIDTMICIARHESGLRPDAIAVVNNGGPQKNSLDVGLFQINSYFWARPTAKGGCGVEEFELLDPWINARCARQVFNRHGYNGWIAYKKHRFLCDNYVADAR